MCVYVGLCTRIDSISEHVLVHMKFIGYSY